MITNTNKPKMLLVCDKFQPGEKKALGNAILEAGKMLGYDADKLKKNLADDLIQEELADKEFPTTFGVGTQGDLVGRILAVGIAAYNKVSIFQDRALIERVPQPRSWDDKMRADAVVAIARILNGWGNTPEICAPLTPALIQLAAAQPKKPAPKKQPGFFDPPTEEEQARAAELRASAKAVVPSTPNPIPDKAFDADLETLEKMLRIEVANNRLQAAIFHWDLKGSSIEIKNAGISTKVALDNLVPILVDDAVLKDERKAKEVRDNLDKAGYKNPYLMSIREFTMVVRLYQGLVKERKIVLELVA